MSFNNPGNTSRVVRAVARASYGTGATNGTGFAIKGFRTAYVVLDCGTLGTAATVDCKIQESDTLGSGYVDITSAAFVQKVKATDDDALAVGELDLRAPRLKFLRAVVTVGAAASVAGVTVVLGNPDRTERVSQAQGGSEAVAAPVAAGLEFSV